MWVDLCRSRAAVYGWKWHHLKPELRRLCRGNEVQPYFMGFGTSQHTQLAMRMLIGADIPLSLPTLLGD